jgi:ferredoxin
MAFKIIASQCSACGACEFECPNAAIRMKADTYIIDAVEMHGMRRRAATLRRRLPGGKHLRQILTPPDPIVAAPDAAFFLIQKRRSP